MEHPRIVSPALGGPSSRTPRGGREQMLPDLLTESGGQLQMLQDLFPSDQFNVHVCVMQHNAEHPNTAHSSATSRRVNSAVSTSSSRAHRSRMNGDNVVYVARSRSNYSSMRGAHHTGDVDVVQHDGHRGGNSSHHHHHHRQLRSSTSSNIPRDLDIPWPPSTSSSNSEGDGLDRKDSDIQRSSRQHDLKEPTKSVSGGCSERAQIVPRIRKRRTGGSNVTNEHEQDWSAISDSFANMSHVTRHMSHNVNVSHDHGRVDCEEDDDDNDEYALEAGVYGQENRSPMPRAASVSPPSRRVLRTMTSSQQHTVASTTTTVSADEPLVRALTFSRMSTMSDTIQQQQKHKHKHQKKQQQRKNRLLRNRTKQQQQQQYYSHDTTDDSQQEDEENQDRQNVQNNFSASSNGSISNGNISSWNNNRIKDGISNGVLNSVATEAAAAAVVVKSSEEPSHEGEDAVADYSGESNSLFSSTLGGQEQSVTLDEARAFAKALKERFVHN